MLLWPLLLLLLLLAVVAPIWPMHAHPNTCNHYSCWMTSMR
jgi:hypothetical protein